MFSIYFVCVFLNLQFISAFIYFGKYYFQYVLNIEMFHWFLTWRKFWYEHNKRRARALLSCFIESWIELSLGNEKATLIYHKENIMYSWCAASKCLVRILAHNCSTFYFILPFCFRRSRHDYIARRLWMKSVKFKIMTLLLRWCMHRKVFDVLWLHRFVVCSSHINLLLSRMFILAPLLSFLLIHSLACSHKRWLLFLHCIVAVEFFVVIWNKFYGKFSNWPSLQSTVNNIKPISSEIPQ